MIVSIGEILADIFFDQSKGDMTARLGGAPFNMAVSAKRTGADVAFIGRVGVDVLGNWLAAECEKYGVDPYIQRDPYHNTTIAMVALNNGERDFAFLRKYCADYFVEVGEELLDRLKPDVIHVGSLMLNEEKGVETAEKLFSYAKRKGIKTSFDVNFRSDIFENEKAAIAAYSPFIEKADIVKFSEDEITLFTGLSPEDGVKTFKDKIVCVTLGEKGSLVDAYGKIVRRPTKKVKPVDTTGAGDAFYGAFLAGIDQTKDLSEENLANILDSANAKGAEATQFLGAIKL